MTETVTAEMGDGLKPCPYCGGRALNAHLAGSAYFIAADHDDACIWASFMRSEAEAIAAWNRRPTPDMTEVVAVLRSLIPTNLGDNPLVGDDVCIPVDLTMEEVRRARTLLAKLEGA